MIVARRLHSVERGTVDEIGRELEAAVARWANSQQQGDLHAHLSLYDEDFRHWNMNKQEWLAFRAEIMGARPIQTATISDLLLLADPVNTDTYLSRFRLAVTRDGQTMELTKRLYWRRSAGGNPTIIAEDSG